MEHFTPLASSIGGALIGLSAALMLLGLGRIAGVSGIFAGLVQRDRRELGWRLAFVLGLVAGGLIAQALAPELFRFALDRSLVAIAAAGLLVGVGTRLGNGCTSGHGVCGVSRGSTRSIAATAVFVATGILTVFVTQRVLGGSL